MKTLLQTLFFFLLLTQICFGQWYQQNSGTTQNLNGVAFYDLNNGIVVGDTGIILGTTNGGTSWIVFPPSGNNINLYAVSYRSGNWVAVGAEGTILRNGNIQPSGTTNDLFGISFLDANYGIAVGDSSTILRTTNAGSNWTNLGTNDSTIILRSVYFIDANKGFAVGDIDLGNIYGIILHTNNGGVSWDTTIVYPSVLEGIGNSGSQATEQKSPDCLPNAHLTFIQFTDDQSGWIVGWFGCLGITQTPDEGIILNTNDGGISWQKNARIVSFYPNSIHFVNSSTGWVAGRYDTFGSQDYSPIYFTMDSGSNWSAQCPYLEQSLNDIYFVDQMNGWAVGSGGTILHTTNGGVSFVEEEQINEVPTEFLLSQNFPNPFNPRTSIQYAISSRQFVSLKVYDVLGNEIETLVNEEKPTGTYELTWYAENLPSGVYFYQLQAGSFIETKKMILIK